MSTKEREQAQSVGARSVVREVPSILKLRENGHNNSQHCWANSGKQTDVTTPNIYCEPTMLGVVAPVLTVVCKRM